MLHTASETSLHLPRSLPNHRKASFIPPIGGSLQVSPMGQQLELMRTLQKGALAWDAKGDEDCSPFIPGYEKTDV
jgi:hypothetical protein